MAKGKGGGNKDEKKGGGAAAAPKAADAKPAEAKGGKGGVTETVDRLLNSVKLPVYTWIGPFQLFIIIDNPEDLEILLSDPNALGKPYIYKFFKKDRGLVAADG
uniref:Uncharacterized protein n=1 Tax=Phlebotomus papatasi TaxID=29031 RepID=A0A1B0D9C4_PHLPP